MRFYVLFLYTAYLHNAIRFLKGMFGQVGSVLELYHWICLGQGIPLYTYIFNFFYFYLEFLKVARSSKALTAQIFPIIIGFGGRQV
jgi:hypothetical protein